MTDPGIATWCLLAAAVVVCTICLGGTLRAGDVWRFAQRRRQSSVDVTTRPSRTERADRAPRRT